MTALSFARLYVANRGEIARRIFRTARRMGVQTAVGFAEVDAGHPFVREADVSAPLSGVSPRAAYLDARRTIETALALGCEAVHPGYGFLSENADFAQAVVDAGLIWVGPPPSAIRAMGLKDSAKALMAAAGVSTTPGYLGEDQSLRGLQVQARALGYPVLIKAVAGGGGKGMRRVDEDAAFPAALAAAQREALSSFGDDRVMLEIYVRRPRHIEVQVFADKGGRVVHLFERDCSLQRRHQKVIEEAPAPGFSPEARLAATQAAVRAAEAVGYVGAGTVEFIADASDGVQPDKIWFMEMNTRLQVEHPVTELITGIDLVEWQLRIADGQDLPLGQAQIQSRGCAIEARLYAENPANGFLPSTGVLQRFDLPAEGPLLRVDAGVEAGCEVTADFDPMLAKIIAYGPDRASAAQRLKDACASVQAYPVRTNAGFLAKCLAHPDFLSGEVDTGFIGRHADALAPADHPSDRALSAAARRLQRDQGSESAFGAGFEGFRLNAPPDLRSVVRLNGRLVPTILAPDLEGVGLAPSQSGVLIFEDGEVFDVVSADAAQSGDAWLAASDGRLTAPMPGRIVLVAVEPGQAVAQGETLIALEAMKMEHVVTAPFNGHVREIRVQVGDQTREGEVLVVVDAA